MPLNIWLEVRRAYRDLRRYSDEEDKEVIGREVRYFIITHYEETLRRVRDLAVRALDRRDRRINRDGMAYALGMIGFQLEQIDRQEHLEHAYDSQT